MRTFLTVILILVSSASYAQTPWNFPMTHMYDYPTVEISFGQYLEEHCELGAGFHSLLIIPGGHLKMRYAPINSNKFKLLGEVRGELYLGPLAGWNYNVQVGTTFMGDVGLHAGIGRSHYVGGMRLDSTQPLNILRFNTFEIGANTLIRNHRFDVFVSIPLYSERIPLIVTGISWSAGDLWYLRNNQGLLGRKKSLL